jgi:AhpC/TSA family
MQSCNMLSLTFAAARARLAQLEPKMKRLVPMALLCAALLSPLAGGQNNGAGQMPKVGELAPDFKMSYFDGHDLKDVTLAQFRGQKQVVLAFYVFAFTGG